MKSTDEQTTRTGAGSASALFAAGDIDGRQLKRGSTELRAALGNVDARLAAARASSAVANLVLAGGRPARHLGGATEAALNVRGKVINALMTVTVLAGVRGRKPGGAPLRPLADPDRLEGLTPEYGAAHGVSGSDSALVVSRPN